MGKSNRTKGIKNRGSQIHRDKLKEWKKNGELPSEWLNALYGNKFRNIEEEHDDPRDDIPSNAI
jgi:hypothetical protein